MSRDAVPVCNPLPLLPRNATEGVPYKAERASGVPLHGETEAFLPSFRPFAQKPLFGPHCANVFWTFIVPKKFRGFDQPP
jgi:hypothetical protein